MNLAEKTELVSRCMRLILKLGKEASKDSLFYDVEGMRIDAWRYQEDHTELHLSLRVPIGYTVFSVQAQPFIRAEEIAAARWEEDLGADALKKLRSMMVLDDLADA